GPKPARPCSIVSPGRFSVRENLIDTGFGVPHICFDMTKERIRFTSIAELRSACFDLSTGDAVAAAAVASHQTLLTKPARSLGRLEDLVAWLARWRECNPPRLDRVEVLVFAGTHGVTAQGVSAFPSGVTAQMVANFAAGGAAINQLAGIAGAKLRVEA